MAQRKMDNKVMEVTYNETTETELNPPINEDIPLGEIDTVGTKTELVEKSKDETDRPRLKRQDTTSYVAKKTAVQGLMDVALLSANANQLRYVLEYGVNDKSYLVLIGLISTSLVLQLLVGLSLIIKGRYYYRNQKKQAEKLNEYVLIGMFLITTINVFVATFTQITPNSPINNLRLDNRFGNNSTDIETD